MHVVARPFTFQVGTLNVLGGQHTRGALPYGPGASARLALRHGRGAWGDLLGLQEVQGDQFSVLYNQLGSYAIWPGRSLGNNGVRLQIAYRADSSSSWTPAAIMTRFDYMFRPIPYVLLRDRATGGILGGQHPQLPSHPGARPRCRHRERDRAVQSAACHRPTSDRDRRHEQEGRVVLQGCHGRRHGRRQRRQRRRGLYLPPGPLRIDWIMGSGVDFSGYVQDGASLAGITDHWFVRSTVTVIPTNLVLRQR